MSSLELEEQQENIKQETALEQRPSASMVTPFRDDELSIEVLQKILSSWLHELPIPCNKKRNKCSDCTCANNDYTTLCKDEVNYCALLFKDYQKTNDVETLMDYNDIKDLIRIDLEIRRVDQEQDGAYEIEQPVGIDDTGNVIVQKQLANRVEYMDRLYRRKDIIRKRIGKAQGKADKDIHKPMDYSVVAAKIKSDHRLRRELEQQKAKELGVSD